MNLRFALFICFLPIYGFSPSSSFADDNRFTLVPESSYCTYSEHDPRYDLGVIGTDWALTFQVLADSFSGKAQRNKAYFYRGPDIRRYIRKSGGPARPPFPTTKAYTTVELEINVHIQGVENRNSGFPIKLLVNDFVANNQRFHIPGPVNSACSQPLP